MSSQLERWRGEFGREYLVRNVIDWRTRVDSLRRIVPRETRSVLEVGCSAGHNLLALYSLGLSVAGTEPADYARQQALRNGLRVCSCSAYGATCSGHIADLVLTSGVLIHVPPKRLDEALSNIYAVASRHILAIEYFAAEDSAVEYRGHPDMLWKRDYGKHYQRLFPDLTLEQSGVLPSGFDGATYWLLAK